MLDVAAEAHEAGTGIIRCAEFGKGFCPHLYNMLHIAERLHVVDDGGAHVEAESGREVGRFDARVGAFAFEALNQAGFLTANIGAGAAVYVNLQIVSAAEDILAEVALGTRLGKGGVDDLRAFGEFAADINVGEVHVVRPAGNDHAFDELVRILVNDLLVLERARFGFVRVANEINRLGIRMAYEAPFEPAGKASTAASAQAGIQHALA